MSDPDDLPQVAAELLPDESEERLLKAACCTGVVCCAFVIAAVVALAISGALVMARSCQSYPEDEAVRTAAMKAFAAAETFHAVAGQVTLVPALVLLAASILFALHIGAFPASRCRVPWSQPLRAASVLAVLVVMAWWGSAYATSLREMHYWLTMPAGGYPDGAPMALGEVISAAKYSTFLAIHGILMPLLAVVLLITMWPRFYEVIAVKKVTIGGKWLKLTDAGKS